MYVCSHSYVSGDFKIVSMLLLQLVAIQTSILITSKLFRGVLCCVVPDISVYHVAELVCQKN